MINENGLYEDNKGEVWIYSEEDKDKDSPVVTLRHYKSHKKYGFYRTGENIGINNKTTIVRKITKEEKPEYWL
jgi:hypothetical protein